MPADGVRVPSGDHWYEPDDGVPAAISVVLWPAHRFVSGDVMLTWALGFSVMTDESIDVHPVRTSVTVT